MPSQQGRGDPCSIVVGREKLRFFLVGQARHLHQDRRHLGADEHGERRHLHAPVRKPGVDCAERAIQLGIDRPRERARLVPALVDVDLLEQPPIGAERVAGLTVLRPGQLQDGGIVGRAHVVGLDRAHVAPRDPVDVDRHEDVRAPRIGEGHALLERHGHVRLARQEHLERGVLQQPAEPECQVERDLLLARARLGRGARLGAAVARVEHDALDREREHGAREASRRGLRCLDGLRCVGGVGCPGWPAVPRMALLDPLRAPALRRAP